MIVHINETEAWARLTIDRPAKRNAMTADMWADFGEQVRRVARAGCRALLIQGGGTTFVAGSDLAELALREPSDGLAGLAQRVLGDLASLPLVTIAAINGAALGGGLEIALACDIRVAARGATFASPEMQLGMVPGAGATQRLSGIVGDGRAAEMILTGRLVGAAEAREIGLVTDVVDDDELTGVAAELARALAQRDPFALQGALAALRAARSGSNQAGYALERLAQALCFSSGRPQEHIRKETGR